MYTKLFWKDLLERLVATLAQVAAGLLTSDVLGKNIGTFAGLPWEAWAVTLLVSGLLVVLKALAAVRKDDTISPASFVAAAPEGLPAEPIEEVGPAVDGNTVGARRIR